MDKIDVVISYDLNDLEKDVIKTNTSKEDVRKILTLSLIFHLGQKEDPREPDEKDLYEVKISFDPKKNFLEVDSDTRNNNLTCGIILDMLGRLDFVEIVKL